MGRPYQSELAALPKTIAWAMAFDVRRFTEMIGRTLGRPLVAAGSGGSLSAAKLASNFHQISGSALATSATPLELLAIERPHVDASFLLLSAGGSNSDILSAFEHLVITEPREVLAVTAKVGSPLAALARRFPATHCVELNLPSGKDGFLATNSLAAFAVVLARAYYSAVEARGFAPPWLVRLTAAKNWAAYLESLAEQSAALWARENLVVLYPPEAEAGAIDIESKFTEAALGNVQIADYRHFAHGRHHWLAKRGQLSAVLGFVTPRFRQLARRTLGCLPKHIPLMLVELPKDPFESALSSVLAAIVLAGCAGKSRGIDPGRPGVPGFGRKIYHLRWSSPRNKWTRNASIEDTAVERKLVAVSVGGRGRREHEGEWRKACTQFCARLERLSLKAAVFDFDGTLVFTDDRFDPLLSETTSHLIRLLRAGVVVGVASGRGKSLRQALQDALPRKLWERVILGYYNGAQIGSLSDNALPKLLPSHAKLVQIQGHLAGAPARAMWTRLEARHNQLSVSPRHGVRVEELWKIIMETIVGSGLGGLKVVRSGHSVDILTGDVSKLAVVQAVCRAADAGPEEVLRIGDRGLWPGNDYELLTQFPSLSVHEVSTAVDTCWNLAPRGHVGPQALGDYCGAMSLGKGAFSMKLKRIGKGPR